MRIPIPAWTARSVSLIALSLLSALTHGTLLDFFDLSKALGSSSMQPQTFDNIDVEPLLEIEGVLEVGDSTLSNGSLYDEYVFSGRAGETVIITLESLEFDTYLLLIDEQRERIIASTQDSGISQTLPADGEYRVVVNAYQERGQGTYRLVVVAGEVASAPSDAALWQDNAERLLRQGDEEFKTSQFREALASWQSALKIYQEIGKVYGRSRALIIGEGIALGNLGAAHAALSQYQQAIDFFQKSLAIAREIDDRTGQAAALGNLGNAYNFLGQYQQAVDLCQQSLAIAREIDDRARQARALGNLGHAYNKLGQYQQAIDLFEQDLDIAREVDDRAGQGAALGNLGSAYFNLGEYRQAINLLRQQLAITQEIGERAGEGLALGNLGIAYRRLGQYRRAITFFEQYIAIAQEIDDRVGQGDALGDLGRLYSAQDKPELAILFLKESVNVRETIRGGIQGLSSNLQQSYTDTIANDYRFLADLLLSQGRIIEAQQVLELLKLEELREFTRTRQGLESEDGIALNPIEDGILEDFITLVNFGKQVYDCEQSSCDQLEDYQKLRRSQASRFDKQVTTFIATIRDNRQNDDFFYDPRYLNETARDIVAQPGTLLIYPFVTSDRLWLLYTAAGDVAGAVPVDVNQLELGQTVVDFRELLESPGSSITDLQATGKQLYDWLVAPMESEIQANNIDKLVFSQDRVTRYIPMGALWDGTQYLTQGYTVSTVLSAELTDMGDKPLSSATEMPRVFALGLSEAKLDLDPLPHVESELDRVVREDDDDDQGVFPGTQLLNDGFNRDAFTTNLFGHRIIHIATHGKFVAGLPEESYLVLGDGDPFSIPDINSIGSDLRDVHLVVLSACETAVGGPGADGIEVAGISSYFLAAGRASSVLASLWLVNDASTSLLMQQFYENLADGEMTKAEALRAAQRAMLEGTMDQVLVESISRSIVEWDEDGGGTAEDSTSQSNLSHPFYWAPFILIGDG